MSIFKTGGPEVHYEYGAVRCCRIWPVVTATFTWDQREERFKREQWWWRTCGLCREVPVLVQEDRP